MKEQRTVAEAVTSGDAPSAVHVRLTDSGWRWWPQFVLRGAGFPAEGIITLADVELGAVADRILDTPDLDGPRRASLEREIDERTDAIRRQVRQIARSERFRAAVTWQNPQAVETILDPLLVKAEDDRGGASRRRKKERAIAQYWQRYCVKNDSIGFFGPMSWGEITTAGTAVDLRVGSRLVADRRAYLEPWAVAVLARNLDPDGRLEPWLAPRRTPLLRFDGDEVLLPAHPAVRPDQVTFRILTLADGTIPAIRLAERVAAEFGDLTPEAVLERLRTLRKRRWLTWEAGVGGDLDALDRLRAQLTRIADPVVREPALDAVAELERCRDDILDVAEDSVRLRAAMENVAAVFTRLTGASAERHQGRTYAGRTLVFEDCRRDVDLRLGLPFVRALAPVDLLLLAARWVTWEIRTRLMREVTERHDALRARLGRPVDVATLWMECMPLIRGGLPVIVREVTEQARAKWATILEAAGGATDGRRRVFATSALRPLVAAAFAAPRSGWSEARYCSPDVMIAATGVDAINRGEFQLVLGELHIGTNTLDYQCLYDRHQWPERLYRCMDEDFPGPRLLPVLPRETVRLYTPRTHRALVRDCDYVVALTPWNAPPSRGRVVAGADLHVTRGADGLVVVAPGGEVFELIDVLSEALKDVLHLLNVTFFHAEHSPRIQFDDLVVVREHWAVDADSMDFARQPDGTPRLVAARRWWRQRGLPDQVFVRSPLEVKPFFMDINSPVYLDVLCKAANAVMRSPAVDGRRPWLTFTEMMPNTGQSWLVDRSGDHYTCELRMAVVDCADTGSAR